MSESAEKSSSSIPKKLKSSDKLRIRREKNNVASVVSRAKRRQRVKGIKEREEELQVENKKLRAQVEEITIETEKLRILLVQKLSQ